MCGGGIVKELFTPVSDVAATVAGFPELIPAINATETVAQGGSLLQGVESGGEALAGQEALGAVGVGNGNSIFNNALGITGDNPAGTGLPDIGGGISDAFSSLVSGGSATPSAPAIGTDTSSIQGTAPNTYSVPSAGAGPNAGVGAGSIAAPSSVGGGTNFDTSSLDNVVNNLQSTSGLSDVGSSATSSSAPGSSNVSGGNAGTYNASNPAGGLKVSDLGANIQSGGSTGNFISDLVNQPGAPSAGTVASNNAMYDSVQPSSNGISPVIDSLASGSGAAGPGTSVTPSAGGATGPSSVQNFFANPSLSTAGSVIAANPGAAISGAGLGIDALMGAKSLEGERQLKNAASQEATQGAQLENYLTSGTLPPGLQAGIQQATDSAIATIKSQYAARGMSGSSAEQQDIANIQAQAEAQGAQMAMQLLNTGIQETGMSSQLYEALLNQATQGDSALGGAIANFASAASGGSGLSPSQLMTLLSKGGSATGTAA